MMRNPQMVTDIERVLPRNGLSSDAPIFVICRSGGRSAEAFNAVAARGYTNVWKLVEGFKSDMNEAGKRQINVWRNPSLGAGALTMRECGAPILHRYQNPAKPMLRAGSLLSVHALLHR